MNKNDFTKISDWSCPKCEGTLTNRGGQFLSNDTRLIIKCSSKYCDFISMLLIPKNPEFSYEITHLEK